MTQVQVAMLKDLVENGVMGIGPRLALRAAIAELDWRPIEEVPVNQAVLVYIPNWEHYGPAVYRAIHVDAGTGKRWYGSAWGIGRDLGADAQPTHFRPLPSGPEGV